MGWFILVLVTYYILFLNILRVIPNLHDCIHRTRRGDVALSAVPRMPPPSQQHRSLAVVALEGTTATTTHLQRRASMVAPARPWSPPDTSQEDRRQHPRSLPQSPTGMVVQTAQGQLTPPAEV